MICKGELVQSLGALISSGSRVLLLLQNLAEYCSEFGPAYSLSEVLPWQARDGGFILTAPVCWLAALMGCFIPTWQGLVEENTPRFRKIDFNFGAYVNNRKKTLKLRFNMECARIVMFSDVRHGSH